MSSSNPASHHHAADSWSERAKQYDRVIDILEQEMRRVTEAMLNAVRAGPGTRLLDLACGPGHVTAAAQTRGAEALGIDVTLAMVEAARRRFPDSRFAVGDMLDPPHGPWDAVTCRLGAHHVDESWMKAAWRVLTPGGRIAIAELDPTDSVSRDNGMRLPAEWARLLEGAGFEDVAVTTCTLRLGTLAAREQGLAAMAQEGHGGHFHDGPVYIIAGSKRQ
jgi:ubiquinone/menaquinone biosynthesis C-methylase UbiE